MVMYDKIVKTANEVKYNKRHTVGTVPKCYRKPSTQRQN